MIHLPIFLYVDNAVILSLSHTGYSRAIIACHKEHLRVKYPKTKIMFFFKKSKNYSWAIKDHNIEQVNLLSCVNILSQ